MNEILLVDMMSQINPQLLQDDSIEKDLRRGIITFFKNIFSNKKTSSKIYEFSKKALLAQDTEISKKEDELSLKEDELLFNENKMVLLEVDKEKFNIKDLFIPEQSQWDTNDIHSEDSLKKGFSISIFKRKIHGLITIISGIIATIVIVIGIVIIIFKRKKSEIKIGHKKVSIIY